MINIGLVLVFITFFPRIINASFDQSAKILVPLAQVEQTVKKLFVDAGVADGNQRFERFKKHIEVLKTDLRCTDFMNELKVTGFSDLFPNKAKDFLTLNILGLKPTTLCVCNHDAEAIIDKLISEKKVTDILYKIDPLVGNKIISKPTIPLKVVFQSYLPGSDNWETNFCREKLSEEFKDVDDPHQLYEKLKNFGDFASSSDVCIESGSAVFLGLQPIAAGIYLHDIHIKNFLNNFHILLDVLPFKILPHRSIPLLWDKDKIRPLRVWGGSPRMNFTRQEQKPSEDYDSFSKKEHLRECLFNTLTFCANLENYRFTLYAGIKAYNDDSLYIKLVGSLLEYFFCKAFDEQTYLQHLYSRIMNQISTLGHSLKSDYVQNLVGNEAWNDWNTFYQDVTGPDKDSLSEEKKQSCPPLDATFEKFLDKIFGAGVWARDAVSGHVSIEESKQDAALKHFLLMVDPQPLKNPLEEKLKELKNNLLSVKKKLESLGMQLGILKQKLIKNKSI